MRFTDPVPADTELVAGSVSTSQGVVTSSGASSPVTVNVGDMAAGAVVTVSFQVIIDSAPASTVLSNQATVTRTGDATGVNSDDNGDGSDGLNPTLTALGVTLPASLTKNLITTSQGGDASANVQIGEVLTYEIGFTAPAGVTREVTLSDALPDGLEYVAGTAQLAREFGKGLTASLNPGNINNQLNGVFTPLSDNAEVTFSGQTLRVFLGDVTNSDNDANAERLVLRLQARVANVAVNQAGAALDNTGELSYRNAAGQVSNLSPANHTATVVEPNLQLVKTANVNALLPNTLSVAGFTLTLTNPAGANVATAYNISISDALPAGFSAANNLVFTPEGGVTGSSCSFTGLVLTCSADEFPPDGQLTVSYDATTTANLGENASLINAGQADWTSLPGSDSGERTGAGGVNDYADASAVTIRVGTPTLVKSIIDPQNRYAIGDEITYQVVMSIPGALNNASFEDVLPAGLTAIDGSLTLNYSSGLSSTLSPNAFVRTDNTPAMGQETLALDFGALLNNSGAVSTLTLTYQARVDNLLSNQDGATLTNLAALAYDRPGATGRATLSDDDTMTVGEPLLTMAQTIQSPVTNLDASSVITYQVTLTNIGNTPAFDTVLTERLPPGLRNVQGVTVALTNSSGNSQTPTITPTGPAPATDGWNTDAFDLYPGDSVTVTFTATLQNGVQPGQTLQATLDATYTSRDGVDANERDGSTSGSSQTDDGALNNYNVEALSPIVTVHDPVALNKAFYPNPAKTAYAIGEVVTYRLTVALSEGTINNVTVTDILPANLTFVSAIVGAGHTDITTGYGGAPIQNGQTLDFVFGTILNPANDAVTDDFVTIDIQARVDNVAANQSGEIRGNAASLRFTDTTNLPQTRTFDADGQTPGDQPLNLTVVEPNLQLTKTVNPASISLGDEAAFTLTLDHTATSTADAYDLEVTDTLPVGLSYVTNSAAPAPSRVSADGRTLTWSLASLTRATDNVAIAYRARVAPDAFVGANLTNTAALRYASIVAATGAADSGRNGNGGTLNNYAATDAATITPTASAAMTAQKAVAIITDVNGNTQADPGDTLQYTVTLANTGGEAVKNVVFTDAIPANTEYVANSSSPSGVFSNDTLTVAVGDLAANSSTPIQFRVRINTDTPAGVVISNQGVVDSDQTVPTPTDGDGNPTNGAQPTTIPVSSGQPSGGALTAEKQVMLLNDTAPTGVVSSGDTLRYTVVLRNAGATNLTDLTFGDPIPGGLRYIDGSASPAAALAGGTLTWDNLSIPAGGNLTLSFDVTINVFTEAEKVFSNQGMASSPELGNVLTDGNGDLGDGAQPTVITAATGNGAPDLDMQKRWSLAVDVAGDGAVTPGDVLLYTLIVSNSGSVAANDARIIDDPLPTQVTLITGSVLTSRGSVVSENPLTVNLGALNPGELATINFRVMINNGAGGQQASNQATATAANVPRGISSDDDGDSANGRNPTVTPILATPIGQVAGTVFNDFNGDGVQQANEVGLPGVTVGLFDSAGALVTTTTTDASGDYQFANIPIGPYTVREVDPAGYVSTTSNIVPVSVVPGATTPVNFGNQQVGTVSGVVFNDSNGNGRLDPGESGLGGGSVELLDRNGSVAATATVATDGSYRFADVPPGAYVVRETDPAGFVSTTSNTVSVSVAQGGAATANFGAQQIGTVSGVVFNDLNGNGVQDLGEAGVSGVTVTLTNGGAPRTAVTGSNGAYLFTAVTPGAYRVIETDPSDFVSTTSNTVPISVPPGGAAIANFGDQPVGAVSGVAFNDLSGNSQQDAGEPGIGGVTVELRDSNGSVVQTATTDVNGRYQFIGVIPGAYTVREIDPAGFVSITPNEVMITVPPSGAANANFGDQQIGAVSGRVFNDLKGNGAQDAGEVGIGGVRIELINAGGKVVQSAITAGDGGYFFPAVPPGAYTVREIDPSGFVSTTSNSMSVSIAPNSAATINFGDRQPDTPRLDFTAQPLCFRNEAYVDYAVVPVGVDTPNGVTLTWVKADGAIVQTLVNQPLTGRLLWPGAAVDANGAATDWPGWDFVNGQWTPVSDGLRPTMRLVATVNPSAEATVTYPPATAECSANPPAAPAVFDPPSGRKTVNSAGYPVFEWRMVWINNGNEQANRVQVVDPIPAGTTYEPNSLRCQARGESTVAVCAFEQESNRIVYEGNIAPDPAAQDESSAQNAVLIVFQTRLQSGVAEASNLAIAYWDENNDGRLEDELLNGQTPAHTDRGEAISTPLPSSVDAILFPYFVISDTVTSIVSIINQAEYDPGSTQTQTLHYTAYYKHGANAGDATASCEEVNVRRVTSPNDLVTFDLGGHFGDPQSVLHEPAERQINARYADANQSFALMAELQPVRGFLIVDNHEPPNLPFENSLDGEMIILDFAQGAAWGYQAYNAAPLTELNDALDATLYAFEDATERSGEVLAGRRDLTPTALNGGVSPAVPVAIMPMAGIAQDGITTRFFVTPIGHSVTFPANAVANPTVINGQAVVGPRHQHRGDLTAEILLMVGNSNDAANSDVFFDRDENPLSGRIAQSITCVAAIDINMLLNEAVLRRIGELGGWSAIAVRSPGPLAELGGDSNPPTATRTAYANQATILKLEFHAEGAFSGQQLRGGYNNAFWLRRGIRESVRRIPYPEPDGWPRLLIRSVLDDRQQLIDVGEDFVGDQFQPLTQ